MPLVIPPLGVSPLGQFAPIVYVATPAPPPGVLADAIDYATFEYSSLVDGLHPIDEQVLIALTRLRASGAVVLSTGARFIDVPKLDDSASKALDSEARIALKLLVDQQDIRIVRIAVDIVDDAATVTVVWQNLRALDPTKQKQTSIRLPGQVVFAS